MNTEVIFPLLLAMLSFLAATICFSNIAWPNDDRSEPRITRRYVVGGCLGLFLCFGVLVYLLESFSGSGVAANGSSVSDLLSLSLGIVGLVITALTGMALASAWRAKDQAEEARLAAINATNVASAAIKDFHMQEANFYQKLQKQIAYTEVLELKLKFGAGSQFRVQGSVSNLLCTALSAADLGEMFLVFERICTSEDLLRAFRRYALDGAGLRDYLTQLAASADTTSPQRDLIYTMLSK